MKTYVFRVVVEPDEDRWISYCPALEDHGGASWRYTEEEALYNIRQVVQMTVEGMLEHGESVPEGPPDQVNVYPGTKVSVNI